MSLYQLKPQFQNLLRPCSNWLASCGVTANQVTVFTCLLSIISSASLYVFGQGIWWLLLPLILFIRMALNAIDGMLAKEHNMSSSVGLMLNEVGDLFADAAMYFAFLTVSGVNIYLLFAVILLAWLSEYIAVLINYITGSRANHGPMGKSDRALVFGILALLVAFDACLFDFSMSEIINTLLSLVTALLMITVYRRTMPLFVTKN